MTAQETTTTEAQRELGYDEEKKVDTKHYEDVGLKLDEEKEIVVDTDAKGKDIRIIQWSSMSRPIGDYVG